MAHIAVTGGAGYIGSFTVAALEDQGHQVTVLDNLSLGHRKALGSATKFEHVDLANASLLRGILCRIGCEGVIHFAALAQVPESQREPSKYWDTNLIGTKNLLDAMLVAGVKKIIFSSTAATYGIPENVPQTGITEDAPKSPINVYGDTKLAMERMISGYAGANKMRAIALRYFNACGGDPEGVRGEDHTPESHLIPVIVAAGLGIIDPKRNLNGKVTIMGTDYGTPDGTCVRDYVDVRDLASAHIKSFEHLENLPPGTSMAMNAGTGKGYSVTQVVSAVNEVLHADGKKVPVEFGPRRAGDPPFLVADSSLLQKTVGWTPQFSLKDSISAAVAWWKKNPNGYGDK